jgi:hypothetical protein
MVAVPPATPVTRPEEELTVATDVLLLDHVPPAIDALRLVVLPAHRVDAPVIVPGVATTVKLCTAKQPDPVV